MSKTKFVVQSHKRPHLNKSISFCQTCASGRFQVDFQIVGPGKTVGKGWIVKIISDTLKKGAVSEGKTPALPEVSSFS